MKLSKLISFVLLILISISSSAAPNVIQATVKQGSVPYSVYIVMQPTASIAGSLTDFQFALAIPVSAVSPAPTKTVVSLVSGLTLGATAFLLTTEIVGGVNSYVYTFSMAGSGVANTTYNSGTPYNIVEVFFGGAPLGVRSDVSLVQLPNGGTTGQSNFFVAFNTNADATSTNQFFGAGATNDGQSYSGYSFVSAANIVLPVKFTDFNVSKKDNDALLTWQVESESSITGRYEIERSLNGIDFKKVYSIASKNNGSTTNNYVLTDANLSTVRSTGIIYYRIKQIDKDGKFVSTGIKSLRLNAKPMAVGIYPNPIRNIANLSIDLEQDSNATITINDASGKQVQSIQMPLFKGSNNKKINMGTLASGSYILKVQTASETETISVVKAN